MIFCEDAAVAEGGKVAQVGGCLPHQDNEEVKVPGEEKSEAPPTETVTTEQQQEQMINSVSALWVEGAQNNLK